MSDNGGLAEPAPVRDAVKSGVSRIAAGLQLGAQNIVINATMLGSVGVGKTTLLASMYERFRHVIGDVGLDMQPDHDTSLDLSGYVARLKRLPADVKMTAALSGTSRTRAYNFAMGATGHRAAFTLRFTDYSGKYFTDPQFPDRQEVSEALSASDVILVAIDAPALVEAGGTFDDVVNKPGQVTDQITRLLGESADPRLVILTLLKCETYLRSRDRLDDMIGRVMVSYKPLMDYIGRPGALDRVGCVLAPVQTVGPVTLRTIDLADPDDPVFKFRATRVGAVYAPVDTEQPLRYLLRFVINKYRSGPRWRVIRDQITGINGVLGAAVDAFTEDCKTDGGFEILQDHPLLHAPLPRSARLR
jgi:hypothetical protein